MKCSWPLRSALVLGLSSLSLLFAASQDGEAPSGTPDAAPVAPEGTIPEVAVPQSITPLARYATLDARLSSLAAERPNWFEVRTLATSAEGRPLRIAIVGERERSEPGEKPALLLLPRLADPSLDRPEELVRLLEEIAAKIATDPNTPALLQRTTLYVMPAPLPDLYALEPGAPAPGPSPTLDFPVGWLPWSTLGDSSATEAEKASGALRPGPYPLARPETLALVDFLYWNQNIASLLEVRAADLPVPPKAGAGSLRAFSESALGLSYLHSGQTRGQSLVDHTLELLSALPDLRIDPPTVSALAENLWLVEARIANSGVLPRADQALPAFVRVEGARLRTAMVRASGASSFRPLASDRSGRIEVGPLAGGAQRMLRVVVEAAEGAEVSLRLRSALGARAERSVRLAKE